MAIDANPTWKDCLSYPPQLPGNVFNRNAVRWGAKAAGTCAERLGLRGELDLWLSRPHTVVAESIDLDE